MTTWTREQSEILVQHYPSKRTDEVARMIGRSVKAVHRMASTFGIRKSPEFLASPDSGRARPGMEPRIQK